MLIVKTRPLQFRAFSSDDPFSSDLVFNFGSGTTREMWQAFRCLATVFRGPQFYDKWCKVDAHRDSWIELWRFQNGTTGGTRYRLWRGQLQEWVA